MGICVWVLFTCVKLYDSWDLFIDLCTHPYHRYNFKNIYRVFSERHVVELEDATVLNQVFCLKGITIARLFRFDHITTVSISQKKSAPNQGLNNVVPTLVHNLVRTALFLTRLYLHLFINFQVLKYSETLTIKSYVYIVRVFVRFLSWVTNLGRMYHDMHSIKSPSCLGLVVPPVLKLLTNVKIKKNNTGPPLKNHWTKLNMNCFSEATRSLLKSTLTHSQWKIECF